MEFMIPRWFLRYRDQNSSSGRKDRQQNICITTVIVTSHQHILMKNNGIIKKRAVLIRHDSMKDVGLDQKDVSRFGRDGQNMNDWLDAVRLQIIQQKNPDANDLYLKVLESSHIQEEEYFFHTIHSDWNNIIRTIRENHEHAAESAPIERPMSNDKKVQRFLQALKFKSNPIEEFVSSVMKCRFRLITSLWMNIRS